MAFPTYRKTLVLARSKRALGAVEAVPAETHGFCDLGPLGSFEWALMQAGPESLYIPERLLDGLEKRP